MYKLISKKLHGLFKLNVNLKKKMTTGIYTKVFENGERENIFQRWFILRSRQTISKN